MAAFKPRRPRTSGPLPRPFRRNKPVVAESPAADSRRAQRQQFLRKRGIYLLPNAFTTAALFCGFFAVVQAMNVRFEVAAIAIFVAMVLDGMDGRVARMTHTQSAFGEQFDSLSDMVSFGVAPALGRLFNPEEFEPGVDNVIAFLTESISAQQLEMLAALMDEKKCESLELY